MPPGTTTKDENSKASLSVYIEKFSSSFRDDFLHCAVYRADAVLMEIYRRPCGEGAFRVSDSRAFFYAAVSMVPMALPLAILLASLMTFGNFWRKIRADGHEGFRNFSSSCHAPVDSADFDSVGGGVLFQNNVLPPAQVKMWTLLFSMRQKSPEVEIPEGVFYDQIPGYNLL